VCGKRLKPLLPVLLPALERHGHISLDPALREHLLAVSASTIDRMLSGARASAGGRRARPKTTPAVRRRIPVRTFADWHDPEPGFVEADLVVHCGESMAGSSPRRWSSPTSRAAGSNASRCSCARGPNSRTRVNDHSRVLSANVREQPQFVLAAKNTVTADGAPREAGRPVGPQRAKNARRGLRSPPPARSYDTWLARLHFAKNTVLLIRYDTHAALSG
jgi:hypothetical protein